MPDPEPLWRCVRVHSDPGDHRTKLLSAVVDGVRVYRCEYWSAQPPGGDRTLLHERYYTDDPDRAHRTMEAALATCTEPVEPNDP